MKTLLIIILLFIPKQSYSLNPDIYESTNPGNIDPSNEIKAKLVDK